MTNTLNFSTVANRYTFEITLKMTTPLHIGGSQEDALTADSPIVRDANGQPYIPGSSLKGLMRTASERVAHVITDQSACFLQDGGCSPQKKSPAIKELIEKSKDEEKIYTAIYSALCPVCQTYGGGTIASKVKFNHVTFAEPVKTRARTSNRIDRKTGTAAGGALFSYEYIAADTQFKMVIEAENMTKMNLQILAGALAQLEQNTLRIGGKQAKGLGQIEYIEGTVKEQHFEGTSKEEALAQLLGMKKPQAQDLGSFLHSILLNEVN